MSKSRQNWSEICEAIINKQIDLELHASYYYLNLYCFFKQDWINMPKIAAYFKKASDEEKEHADKFINYQIKRGGRVSIGNIPKIEIEFDENCKSKSYLKKAFELALHLEKKVNAHLLTIHELSDPNLADFIESEFLQEQIDANDELARIINDLEFIGDCKFDLFSYISHFKY